MSHLLDHVSPHPRLSIAAMGMIDATQPGNPLGGLLLTPFDPRHYLLVERRLSLGGKDVTVTPRRSRHWISPSPLANFHTRVDDLVVEALMVALQMVMCDVVSNNGAKMVLSQQNHLIEALILDRTNKAFRVRIQIGTLGRQLYGLHSTCSKGGLKWL